MNTKRGMAIGAIVSGAMAVVYGLLPASAKSQLSYITGVRLQSVTPGTPDAGHAHISGTLLVDGQLGLGLTGSAYRVAVQGPGSGIFAQCTAASGLLYGGRFVNDSSSGIAVSGVATHVTGSNVGGHFSSSGSSGVGVRAYATSSTGTAYAVFGDSSAADGKGLVGVASASSGNTTGVHGYANSADGVGVFGISDGTGVYGESTSTSGLAAGGDFRSASTFGVGLYGIATATTGTNYGVYGQSSSTGGRGVHGIALAATGTTYGGHFRSNSPNGSGVFGESADNVGVRGHATAAAGANYGGYFLTSSTTGFGVFGYATADSGTNYGGYFRTSSATGFGVYGYSTAISGANVGVYGRTESPTGYGVYALQNGGGGVNRAVLAKNIAFDGIGVQGWSSATSGDGHGVVGQADHLVAGSYGVFSLGNTAATGSKSFRIDHPLDPENKYLQHYCAEGPEPLNVYSGEVRTDDRGYAWVQLPDYFESINRDFRYQLTVVDDEDSAEFVLAKVVRRIQGNRFQVRTSVPNVAVSWEVKATRNDRFMQEHGAPTELDKPEYDRGYYQHPELYGLPKERSIRINAHRAPTPREEPATARTK